MKKSVILILFIISLFGCNKTYKGDLIISNTNIIDVDSGEIIPNQTIIIINNRIDTIIDFKDNEKLISENIIHGTNKYITPGLWDMHTHVLWSVPEYQIHNAMMISNGVTGFRDMWGSDSIAKVVKQNFTAKKLPLQRIYRSNQIIDGSPPMWEGTAEVSHPEEAIKMVDSIYNNTNADFIKVYSLLDKETFHAIANRCKELGIDFMGHVPKKISVEEVVNAGIRSVEHMGNMQLALSTARDSLYKILETTTPDPMFLLKTQANDQLDELASLFIKSECAVVPTLVTLKGKFSQLNRHVIDTNGIDGFIPDFCIEQWKNGMPPSPLPPFFSKLIEDSQNRNMEIVGLLHEKGVSILAGTDVACSNAFTYSGFSLHDELQNFVKAGISSNDVLKIATVNSAKFVKMSDSIGLVKTGFLADLLVLKSNPLEDIKNLKKIDAVISNGVLYNNQALDELQNSALKQVQSISKR